MYVLLRELLVVGSPLSTSTTTLLNSQIWCFNYIMNYEHRLLRLGKPKAPLTTTYSTVMHKAYGVAHAVSSHMVGGEPWPTTHYISQPALQVSF